LDFEADPKNKFKPLIKILKTTFSISKSIQFPFITQLKYCQKLEFEADPNNKFKPLIKTSIFFEIKINSISFYNPIKILPKIGFRSFPLISN